MAQPSTDTPAWRFAKGSPNPAGAKNLADGAFTFSAPSTCCKAGEADREGGRPVRGEGGENMRPRRAFGDGRHREIGG